MPPHPEDVVAIVNGQPPPERGASFFIINFHLYLLIIFFYNIINITFNKIISYRRWPPHPPDVVALEEGQPLKGG